MVKLRSSFLVGWGIMLAALGWAAAEASTLPSVRVLGEGCVSCPRAVPVDTVEGEIIPTPIDFPSLSVKLTYDGGFAWQWNALSLWLQEEEFPT